MPSTCADIGCANRGGQDLGISYHRFPLNDPELLKAWMEKLPCRDWKLSRWSKLCSLHFADNCFYQLNNKTYLRQGSVPTVFSSPASKTKRSPRKRSRSRSDEAFLLCQRPKHRHRSHPPERQPGSTTDQPTPGEAQAAAGSGSSVELVTSPSQATTSETPPEAVFMRRNTSFGDHSYAAVSPRLQRVLATSRHKLQKARKLLKQAKKKINRKTARIRKLNTLLRELRTRLPKPAVDILDNAFTNTMRNLVLKRVRHNKNACTEDVRKFALTLHFYSAKAYSFLRKHVKLPHPSTLRKWAAVVDARPGFTQQSFEKVAQEAQKGPLFVSLMVDEMGIKRQTDWDGKEVVGYCDLGHGIIRNDCVTFAKHALVFLAVAVNRNWKIPLGYALIDGLDGNARANLVREYIIKLKDAGAKCISVTCDGTNCNITMLTALGVRFAQPMKSWFTHPSDPTSRVHAVLDACHMLKLMRNLLAEKGCIRDGAGKVVAWRYLAALDNLQQQEGLHAANKLRKQHIDFERQKMKVSLAAQTLSRSVSCALLFCKEKGIQGFEGAEATAKFAAAVDDIFDLTNSCHPLGRGSKCPIRASNQVTILERIEQASRYLRALKDVTGKPLSQGARKTPVLGFLLVLDSIKGLAEDLVWSPSPPLRCLLTRKLSQDHLELFFATVRNRTGNNNNPTALEFRSNKTASATPVSLECTCASEELGGLLSLVLQAPRRLRALRPVSVLLDDRREPPLVCTERRRGCSGSATRWTSGSYVSKGDTTCEWVHKSIPKLPPRESATSSSRKLLAGELPAQGGWNSAFWHSSTAPKDQQDCQCDTGLIGVHMCVRRAWRSAQPRLACTKEAASFASLQCAAGRPT
ncbi:hypothetical protein ISCGN_024323 [Ixodes scapularis]